MRICVFEDCGVAGSELLGRNPPPVPFPGGREILLREQVRFFAADEVGVLVRPGLAERLRREAPTLRVNDLAWLRTAETVLVNACWLPPSGMAADLVTSRVALLGDEIAFVLVGPQKLTYCSPNTLEDCLATWKQVLPCRRAPGQFLRTVGGLACETAVAAR